MFQGRKWQVPNFHPMLLLDKTSIWSLISCENGKFSLAQQNSFCSRYFSPHTHTQKIHTLHISFKSFWPKEKNDTCQMLIPMLLLYNTSVWSLSTCKIEEISLAQQNSFCSRCSSPQTHKKHEYCTNYSKVYDPRMKMMGAKFSSDASAR